MSKQFGAYVQWTRPDGEPGDALEERVFAAVARIVDDLPPGTDADGHDAGTDFSTGERDVSFWFYTRDLGALTWVAETVRDASGGVGSIEVRKAAKPSLADRVRGLWWRVRYAVVPPKPVELPKEIRDLLDGWNPDAGVGK